MAAAAAAVAVCSQVQAAATAAIQAVVCRMPMASQIILQLHMLRGECPSACSCCDFPPPFPMQPHMLRGSPHKAAGVGESLKAAAATGTRCQCPLPYGCCSMCMCLNLPCRTSPLSAKAAVTATCRSKQLALCAGGQSDAAVLLPLVSEPLT
jgi:hypothetical protein